MKLKGRNYKECSYIADFVSCFVSCPLVSLVESILTSQSLAGAPNTFQVMSPFKMCLESWTGQYE